MMVTLRAAVLIASPSDTAGFDTDDEWQRLSELLQPFVSSGCLTLRRIKPATENALRKCLGEEPIDVLHVIGYAQWRTAAHYGTLMLESSTGLARAVSTQYLGSLLAPEAVRPRVAILQLKEVGGERFEDSAQTLWEGGPPAVVVPGAFNEEHRLRVRRLYERLLTGEPPTTLAAPDLTETAAPPEQPSAAGYEPAPSLTLPPDPVRRPQRDSSQRRAEQRRAAEELKRKRQEQAFDVFLCHNNADKSKVREIAASLEARGILPWLDERDVPPGKPWQPAVEQLMAQIRSAAVFVGRAGVGPWQEQELYVLLSEFVSRKSPVIPVLLEDAPEAPMLPAFLRAMAWVDFRCEDPDPLSRLIWGITGKRP